MTIKGNIHSIESCGTVDGPGIRFVIFMQGCPMRCQYCHNPDSWTTNANKLMTVDEIMQKYDGVKEFVQSGGITVTGGEPLLQINFVTELFKAAKSKNIHTALDTSGITFNPQNTETIDELLKYTDLVLLDIKHINNEEHKKLTGCSNQNILKFAQYLSEKGIPISIKSAPFSAIAQINLSVVSRSGSPAVINGMNAFPFANALSIELFIDLYPLISCYCGYIFISSS